MVYLTNSVGQTIQPGQTVTFDTKVLHTGNGECCGAPYGTIRTINSIKLKSCGIYEINFGANISGGAGTTSQLAVSAGGNVLPDTIMTATTTEVNAISNVSKTFPVNNCCDCLGRISVVNVGDTPIIMSAHPTLFIQRKA